MGEIYYQQGCVYGRSGVAISSFEGASLQRTYNEPAAKVERRYFG